MGRVLGGLTVRSTVGRAEKARTNVSPPDVGRERGRLLKPECFAVR